MDRASNWWVFCLLSNYLSRWFSWTLPSVQWYQALIEGELYDLTQKFEKDLTKDLYKTDCYDECVKDGINKLKEHQEDTAKYVHEKTWDFFWNMTGTFRDMYQVVNPNSDNFITSYKYIEVDRWVYELAGYWGVPGKNI